MYCATDSDDNKDENIYYVFSIENGDGSERRMHLFLLSEKFPKILNIDMEMSPCVNFGIDVNKYTKCYFKVTSHSTD